MTTPPDSIHSEILDVVDQADNVIGQATRFRIHAEGLKHRAVHVLVFDPKGRLYIQRRSHSKDRFPNRLDSSAAGHVDSGESYLDAANRELREELGIEASLREALRVEASEITDQEHVVLYDTETDQVPVPDPDEIIWGSFMSQEELDELMSRTPDDFVPAFIHLWKQYLKVGG